MPTEVSTDWGRVPMTCDAARVIEHKSVNNARVVHLSQGSIRCADVSGAFLLAEGSALETFASKTRIEVQCLWFGKKPPTTWMHITVIGAATFEDSYSGEVAWNIGVP